VVVDRWARFAACDCWVSWTAALNSAVEAVNTSRLSEDKMQGAGRLGKAGESQLTFNPLYSGVGAGIGVWKSKKNSADSSSSSNSTTSGGSSKVQYIDGTAKVVKSNPDDPSDFEKDDRCVQAEGGESVGEETRLTRLSRLSPSLAVTLFLAFTLLFPCIARHLFDLATYTSSARYPSIRLGPPRRFHQSFWG
jgi:hypothetical protein